MRWDVAADRILVATIAGKVLNESLLALLSEGMAGTTGIVPDIME